MDPVVLRATWARASGYGDTFVVWFYARLFAARPDLRPLFGIDMTDQRKLLYDHLDMIVTAADDLTAVAAKLRKLGRVHRRFGVSVEMYPAVEEALIGSLALYLGDGWTPAVEATWRAAYKVVAGEMIAGHLEAEGIGFTARWDTVVTGAWAIDTGVLISYSPPAGFPGRPGEQVAAALHGEPGTWRTGTIGVDDTILFPAGEDDPTVALSLARPGDRLVLSEPLDLEDRS